MRSEGIVSRLWHPFVYELDFGWLKLQKRMVGTRIPSTVSMLTELLERLAFPFRTRHPNRPILPRFGDELVMSFPARQKLLSKLKITFSRVLTFRQPSLKVPQHQKDGNASHFLIKEWKTCAPVY